MQPEQNNFGAGVSEEVGRRTRCRLTGLKSTRHLKSHKDHRSWPRSLDAFSHLSGGLHTYVFRQFRTDLTQYCLRAKIQKMGVVSAIRKGRSSHIHHFPRLFTKRIGNIVVFPALYVNLVMLEYRKISLNSTYTIMIQEWRTQFVNKLRPFTYSLHKTGY